MAVFRDIDMHYGGVDYTLTPSNRLLRRIEAGLSPSSLTGMIGRVAEANPPVSEVAYVASEFLRAAGATVDEDGMYGDLMDDLSNGGAGFGAICEAIVLAISPAEETVKKSLAPSKLAAQAETRSE